MRSLPLNPQKVLLGLPDSAPLLRHTSLIQGSILSFIPRHGVNMGKVAISLGPEPHTQEYDYRCKHGNDYAEFQAVKFPAGTCHGRYPLSTERFMHQSGQLHSL